MVDDEVIVEEYRAGASLARIAYQYGLARQDVRERLVAAGEPIRQGGRQPGQRVASQGPPEVAQEYRAGASLSDLAARYGVSRFVVRRWLVEADESPRHRQGTRKRLDVAAIVEQYRAGAILGDIAAQHGADPGTIRRRLIEAGEPIRARGRRSQRSRS